jgi:hypothetical protein
MKKLFISAAVMLAAISLVSISAFATGGKDLPKNISTSLTAKYPDARVKGWVLRNDQYVVRFVEDKQKCMSYFAADGSWIRTEQLIPLTKDLPPAVKQGFNKSAYSDWHIDRIREVTTPNEQPAYVFHVDDGDKLDSWHVDALESNYLIWFAGDGTFQKKSAYKAE